MKTHAYSILLLALAACSQHSGSKVPSSSSQSIRSNVVNNVLTQVGPPEYLVRWAKDSASASDQAQVTFVVRRSIARTTLPAVSSGDVGTTALDERSNAHELASWNGNARLICGDSIYLPVLAHMEQTHGLSATASLILVFAPHTKADTAFGRTSQLDLVLDDRGMGTGIQHFRFAQNEVQRI